MFRFGACCTKKDKLLLEQVQRKAPKMIRGLKYSSYEKRYSCLSLFSLKKGKHQGYVVASFEYLKEVYRKDRERLFIS